MPAANLSYPEAGVTKATDLAPDISIDYVNRFSQGVERLRKLLGMTNLIPVADGGTVKTYKYTSDIKDGNVAEGEYIPLSFWSGVVLTGNQTEVPKDMRTRAFWSGVVLTGNQTDSYYRSHVRVFWSGVVLTGNQTRPQGGSLQGLFWSGVVLTGNQTPARPRPSTRRFGAVSF